MLAQGCYMCGVSLRDDQKEIAAVRERYGVGVSDYDMTSMLSQICPEVKAKESARVAAIDQEYQAWKADKQRRCDERPRHRPLIKPIAVTRKMIWPEYGVLEAYEGDDAPGEDGRQWGDLVEVGPGLLRVRLDGDPVTCATTETYLRRPPVEIKGWDEVIEVGYRSTAGRLVLGDMEGGDRLPNLTFHGKGAYRIRVHHRSQDWKRDPDGPQDLLIIVYPGHSDRAIVYRGAKHA